VTWSDEAILRDDIAIADALAEASTVELSDETLFTSFSTRRHDDEGRALPFIGGSRWTRNYRRPYGPRLDVPEPNEKYNYPVFE